MKILFLHKDPKECARLHVDEEVIAKIPQYTRILAGAFMLKHGHNPFEGIENGYCVGDPGQGDTGWLLKKRQHRSWLFNVIRHLIKEYDKRFGNAKFAKQREVMSEIANWGNMDNIEWKGTMLEEVKFSGANFVG